MTGTAGPVRVQLSRRKGWKMPPNTVKIDRTTQWGNPFIAGEPEPDRPGEIMATTADCVRAYRQFAEDALAQDGGKFEALRGRNLACWCPLDRPCHGDVLLELANRDHADATWPVITSMEIRK